MAVGAKSLIKKGLKPSGRDVVSDLFRPSAFPAKAG
jgi:hypothetical protein